MVASTRDFVLEEVPKGEYRVATVAQGDVSRITRMEMYELAPPHRLVFPLYLLLPLLAVAGISARPPIWFREYFASSRGLELRDFDWVTVTLVFAVTLVLFHRAPVVQMEDARHITAVSQSLALEASFELPESIGLKKNGERTYTLTERDGKVYHFFSHAPAVLNVPVVALFGATGAWPVMENGDFVYPRELRILRFCAALTGALVCVVFFLFARVWLPPSASLLLSFLFAFGSQIFSTLSRPYWSHAWGVLLLGSALLILVRRPLANRVIGQIAAASCLSWAFFCRPTFSLALVGATVYTVVRYRRVFWAFATTGAAWLGLLIAYSYALFDQLFPPYLLSSHFEIGHLGGKTSMNSYAEAVLGTLVSPGRGFFVYVPIALVAIVVVVFYWNALQDRLLAAIGLAVVVAHWQLVSSFAVWWGGWCFGPRLFSDVLPWVFALAVLGIDAVNQPNGSRRARRVVIATAAVAACFSLFVNVRGATSQATSSWKVPEKESSGGVPPSGFRRTKLWDWRYPQFLAGLVAPPADEPATEPPPEL